MKYKIKDLSDLTWFLEIYVIYNRKNKRLWLSQNSYINKIIISFKVKDYYKIYMPMDINKLKPNLEQAFKQDIYMYQKKVGFMLYTANII